MSQRKKAYVCGRRTEIVSIATALYITNVGMMLIGLQIFFAGKVSDTHIALLSTIYWVPVVVLSPVWGSICDITERRRDIAITTLILVSTLTLLHYIYTDYYQIAVLRAVTGAVSAAYAPAAQSYITSSRSDFGRKLAAYNMSVALGFLLSAYIVSICMILFEARTLFAIASLPPILSAVLLLLLGGDRVKGSKIRAGRILGSVLALLVVRRLPLRARVLYVGLILRYVAIMGLFSIAFVYMLRVGIGAEILGVLFSLNHIAQLVLIPVFGVLADRVGRKKIYVPGFLLSALVPLIFVSASSALMFAAVFLVLGISYSLLISGINPYLRDIAPEGMEAETLSILSTSRGLGMILGPIVVGVTISAAPYGLVFIVLSIFAAIAFFFSLLSEETCRGCA